jgi:hypothetical protein
MSETTAALPSSIIRGKIGARENLPSWLALPRVLCKRHPLWQTIGTRTTSKERPEGRGASNGPQLGR